MRNKKLNSLFCFFRDAGIFQSFSKAAHKADPVGRHDTPPWRALFPFPSSPLQKKHGDEQKFIGSDCTFLSKRLKVSPLLSLLPLPPSRRMMEKLRRIWRGIFSKGINFSLRSLENVTIRHRSVIETPIETIVRHRAYRPDSKLRKP